MNEVTLFRCCCSYCDVAEQHLRRLCGLHNARLKIKWLESDRVLFERFAWSAPLVYLGGRLVSRYGFWPTKWNAAIQSAAQG